MSYWSTAPMDRQQAVMFAPTLDACISEDHPVRLFLEVLDSRDWRAWEVRYDGRRGQPPIHPKVMAGVILYGLTQGIRSSRAMERACGNQLDFLWLAEGRVIDHSTICQFRTSFGKELKGLFREIGRVAMAMGLIRLNQVALDGTRILANSSRHQTARRRHLEGSLAALDQQMEQMLSEAAEADRQEDGLYGEQETPNRLPAALGKLSARRELLEGALETVKQLDGKRSKRRDMGSRGAQIPVADPEARVLQNKDGGSAPNYTPIVGAEGHRGFVVATDLINDNSEDKVAVEMVDQITEDFGDKPGQVLADSNFGTGVNLKELEDRQIEPLMVVSSNHDGPDNPAHRPDVSKAVCEEQRAKLPLNPQSKKLDKCCFLYDRQRDRYHCPMGKSLTFRHTRRYRRKSGLSGIYRVYQCQDCSGCPLGARCVSRVGSRRAVMRDEYEDYRQTAVARLADPAKRKIYDLRMWIVETVVAVVKQRLGVRQFLHRGLKKVKIEWDWVCCAFNLDKLVREIARLRRRFAVAVA